MVRRVHGPKGPEADLRLRRRARSGLAAPLLVALALGVAACGSSSSSSSPASSSTSSSAGAGTTSSSGSSNAVGGVSAAKAQVAKFQQPVTSYKAPGPAINAKPLKGKAVWYVPIGASIPVLENEANAIKAAATAVGMTYHTCDGKLQPAAWAACVTEAVNAGAAGIITDSIDPSTMSVAVAAAKSHHIPLLLGNEADPGTQLLQGMDIGGDAHDQAPMMDWIIADSNGKARILTSTVQGDKATEAEVTTSLAELHKNCPTCVHYNINSTPETLPSVGSGASAALLSHPDITYGFPEFDFFEPIFARGVQTSGHKIKIVSTNDVLANLQEIKSGTGQVADSGANRNYLGWSAMDRLLRMILHKPEPTSITVPVRLFDKQNINSIKLNAAAGANGDWWGPTTYQQEFPKLWGVK